MLGFSTYLSLGHVELFFLDNFSSFMQKLKGYLFFFFKLRYIFIQTRSSEIRGKTVVRYALIL